MAARQLDVQVADGRHADEVVGAGEEAGKRGGERNRPARRKTHRGAHHHLLGDVVLEEPVGRDLLEPIAEGRVAHVGVERDDAVVDGADAGQRRAVSFARRHQVAQLVGRRRDDRARLRRGILDGGLGNGRPQHRDGVGGDRLERRLQLAHGAVRLVTGLEGLAMPALLVLGKRHAPALERLGQDHRRTALRGAGFRQRVKDLGEVVPVNLERVPAKAAPPASERPEIVLPDGGAALPEAIDVGDAHQVVDAEMRGALRRFPDRALRRLAVAHQHVGAVVGLDAPGVERDAEAGGQALA